MKNFNTNNNESGRSMIEMLGVLAIIGVLSVGGIAGYSKAMMKYRINKTIEQITLISGNIRSFFGQQKNYAEVKCSCSFAGCHGVSGIDSSGNITYAINGCPIIKKAKIIPDEMIEYNTDGTIKTIKNLFGYYFEMGPDYKSTSGDNQAFHITYYIGDNIEACIELLTQDWSAANVKAINSFKTPIDVDDAVTYCSKAIAETDYDHLVRGGYPMIVFYFDIDINSSAWSSRTWKN